MVKSRSDLEKKIWWKHGDPIFMKLNKYVCVGQTEGQKTNMTNTLFPKHYTQLRIILNEYTN